MAKIALVWEFGGGLGHIMYSLPLARNLQERGHEVVFIMKHVINADKILSPHGFKVIQAPLWQLVLNRLTTTHNFAEVLFNRGYLVPGALLSITKAWRTLYDLIRPDLVIADYAPSAIIAARGTNIKTALYGTGFFFPPRQSPMPTIVPWKDTNEELFHYSEKKVLEIINDTLQQLNAPVLQRFADLFEVNENFLTTFKELDHYQVREPVKYWGPVISLPEGESPLWPGRKGTKKIFCYLKPNYPHIEWVLQILQQLDDAVIVFMRGIQKELMQKFQSENMTFVTDPLNMLEVCRECDLVVCHAGHGTIAVTLLHGKPLVLLPEHNHLEQILMAYNLREQKFCDTITTGQKKLSYKLVIERVLSDNHYGQKAKGFAEKYKDFSPEAQIDEIADRCEELMDTA
jgi:UDP:flavonoid glycosyltransferase YjiC (YdhE family)